MANNGEQKYLRMTFNERIQHFLLLSSFFTLVITGFALKFPESVWVRWAVDIFGEAAFEWRGTIHRIAAGVMVADSIYHLFYVSFTQRGRKLIKDFWLKKQDVQDLKQSIRYYLGKVKERPKYGRFSYIEKIEYWSMMWGTIVMSLTGGVLWFENMFLPVISNTGMNIATAIHFYEAILATLAIVVWHFYFVIYNPDVYPMNKAWFRGYLTREEMELEHPLELEEIERAAAAEKVPGAEAEIVPEKEELQKKPADIIEEVTESIKESEPQTKGIADTEKISGNNAPKVEEKAEETGSAQSTETSPSNKGDAPPASQQAPGATGRIL
jgi:cytochrome b subunit of formate dehydrogenase